MSDGKSNMKKNVILLSMDEVRPDHLSCYGYDRIRTPNIDSLIEDGVQIEQCIAASSFTAVCMSSVITASYPYRHTVRDAFQVLQGTTAAEVFKEHGYKTAGFVGVSVLGSGHGFQRGFDLFDEPNENSYGLWQKNRLEGGDELFFVGNWWVDRFFDWLDENKSGPFFAWGHYLETHDVAERFLLQEGMIKEGELSEFAYYDAKIRLFDDVVVGRLLKFLRENDLYENTSIVLMADHGCNLGEHPIEFLPHNPDRRYPQHSCAWDCEVKVPLIFHDVALPAGSIVRGAARAIDIVPTAISLADISPQSYEFEGVDLLAEIKDGRLQDREAYIENLTEMMRPGAYQAWRSSRYKYIRNVTTGREEYYDLEFDPLEQNNIIDTIRSYDPTELRRVRLALNDRLWRYKPNEYKSFSDQEQSKITERLRGLGYIE